MKKLSLAVVATLGLATLAIAGQSKPSETVRAKRKPADAWKEYPTRTLAELPPFPASAVPLDEYGGRSDVSLKSTGFFRPEKLPSGRWVLVTPAGHPYVHVALVAVEPTGSAKINANLKAKYGGKSGWVEKALPRLRELGFTGAGAWSDVASLHAAPAGSKLAYTVILDLVSDFAKTRNLTHVQPGNTGYADRVIPVFHPEFPAYCADRAKAIAEYASDPWLLGYFSDNEMPFPELRSFLSIDLEKTPDLKPELDAAKAWWTDRNHGQWKDPAVAGAISEEDTVDFGAFVWDRYLSITTGAIRAVDPKHLCLGSRLVGPDKTRASAWRACAKYVDVVALNYYSTWTPDRQAIAKWKSWSNDKPFLVTEWYTKGADSGMANTTGAGWIVPTQADRGKFYQNFTLALLESGQCVGWHWFKYKDNDPDDPKAEPSNKDSNKGLVSIEFKEYEPLAKAMHDLNTRVYSVMDYFDARK